MVEEKILEEILEEYKKSGYTEELADKFKQTPCDLICASCPLDEIVGPYNVCDHLIHGVRVTAWEKKEEGTLEI